MWYWSLGATGTWYFQRSHSDTTNGQGCYGVGGGIAGQQLEGETKQKAAVLPSGTQNSISFLIKFIKGKLLFLEEHIKRLQESSRCTTILSIQKSTIQVEALCQSLDLTDYRLKCPSKMVELKFEHSQLSNLSDDFILKTRFS